jgi:hypothetical protein
MCDATNLLLIISLPYLNHKWNISLQDLYSLDNAHYCIVHYLNKNTIAP